MRSSSVNSYSVIILPLHQMENLFPSFFMAILYHVPFTQSNGSIAIRPYPTNAEVG